MPADLQCARCGAPVALPSDYAVWLVRCQYCSFEHELGDAAARQAYAERRRQEESQASQARAQAAAAEIARQRGLRQRRIVVTALIAGMVAVLASVGGVVALVASQAVPSTPVAARSPLPSALVVMASKASAAGCPKVLDGPSAQSNEYRGTFSIVKRECMRFLAVSTPAAPLTLQVTDAAGAVTSRTAPSGSLDETFCAQENAEHLVKITGAPAFWLEALACPRVFANDAGTTGMERVGARLKQLMSHGCYEISFAAATFSDDRKLTTPLEAGTCFDVLAATGLPDNLIRAKVSTPFGETIAPLPPPGTDLEIPYCAAAAGPHVVELSPAIDGPFSIAIAICNRGALPKVLPKAGK